MIRKGIGYKQKDAKAGTEGCNTRKDVMMRTGHVSMLATVHTFCWSFGPSSPNKARRNLWCLNRNNYKNNVEFLKQYGRQVSMNVCGHGLFY